MHNGTSTYYAQPAGQFLDKMFPNRWIVRYGPIDWQERSPDVTPTGF